MLKVQPYDYRESFRLIPHKQNYSVLFYIGKNVTFSNKTKAQDFIKSVFQFYNEVLGICEMLSLHCSNYQYHLRPQTSMINNKYFQFQKNLQNINYLLSEIIVSRKIYTTVEKQTRFIIRLINSLEDNYLILHQLDKDCAAAQLVIISNLKNAFNYIIDNVFELYQAKKLSLFTF